jgi:hypothetical protein
MKRAYVLLFTVGVFLCTLAATANAEALKVTVPFDFVVDGNTLPAATYTIREALPNSNTALDFQRDGGQILTQATVTDPEITGTKLVFHKVGDQYFLSDVVAPSGTMHFAVSRKEQQLEADADQPAITVVSANQ